MRYEVCKARSLVLIDLHKGGIDLRFFYPGTYSELLQHNGAFADLIRTYLNDEDDDEDDPEGEVLIIQILINVIIGR